MTQTNSSVFCSALLFAPAVAAEVLALIDDLGLELIDMEVSHENN